MEKYALSFRSVVFVAMASALAACSDSNVNAGAGGGAHLETEMAKVSTATDAEQLQREKVGYLAYEHTLTVSAPEDSLPVLHARVVSACATDRQYGCTLLQSELTTDAYVVGDIRLRIEPGGVEGIIQRASEGAEITYRSTRVEDLAADIVDGEKRIKMLTAYREKLLDLEKRAGNDIESLIKISSEIAKVQSQLEGAAGRDAFLKQRVNMDIVTIHFVEEEAPTSAWNPVLRSLSEFSDNLAEGTSQAVIAVAYILPWLLILLAASYLWRYLRKKGRK